MNIKHIIKAFAVAAVLMFTACEGVLVEPGVNTTLDPNVDNIVSFSRSSGTLSEDLGAEYLIPIEMTNAPSGNITVAYELTVDGATEGVDFVVNSSSPLTISAGTYGANISISPIDNDVFETAARVVTITLTTVSDAGVQVQANKSFTLTLINDDCPVNAAVWSGNVSVLDVGFSAVSGEGVLTSNCNEIFISNMIDIGVPNSPTLFSFEPSADGATDGTCSVERFFLWTDRVELEGTGTYDESTELISLTYTMWLDGAVWFPGVFEVTPQ